jgi:hypothetical protein
MTYLINDSIETIKVESEGRNWRYTYEQSFPVYVQQNYFKSSCEPIRRGIRSLNR